MIKILKCAILEWNSTHLDLQSDALPVELSMPQPCGIITLQI